MYPEDGWPHSRGNTNNNIFTTYSSEKMEWVAKESPSVQYTYYHKQKRVRDTYNIGGNSRSTTREFWHGVLYTDLLVGSDTLKIKENLALIDDGFLNNVTIDGKPLGHVVFTPYVLLEYPQLNYQLLSRGNEHLHIIQPKEK